jgi:ppGpp synthetase/RelA/SpoT-type nucleotidyltranferase
MAWAKLEYRLEEYNAAARLLSRTAFPVTTTDALQALDVINNWRSAHAYPLNTFQITLRNRARKVERNVTVAQRAKRLDSIHRKLLSKKTMRLTQMQDIAGCRAILTRLSSVRKLTDSYKRSDFDHKFRNEKNYIEQPKRDGYRSVHLVYEYVGTDNTAAYNGLRVEIQIRTQMQHSWATAVEAVGIFTKQALKSNQGDEEWLRFFALMSSAIASIEQTVCVPETPTRKDELAAEIEFLADKLKAREMLRAYNTTLRTVGAAKDAKYFIIELDPSEGQITLTRYKAKESSSANTEYTRLESQIPEESRRQVVLVSAADINALKRAYPNYFLDTALFSRLVDRVISRDFPDPRLPIANN